MLEIKCRKDLAAPLITLLKLHHATYVSGVCGILTEGSRNIVEGITLSSQALLSYCIEMSLSDKLTERVGEIDLVIPEGKLTYNSLSEASGGLLLPPPHGDEEIAMVTSPLNLTVLYSHSTYDSPITEEEVMNVGGAINGRVLTPAPLPLLPKVVRFNVERDEDVATITSEDLPQDSLEALFKDISQK